jgi:hypothetical protein
VIKTTPVRYRVASAGSLLISGASANPPDTVAGEVGVEAPAADVDRVVGWDERSGLAERPFASSLLVAEHYRLPRPV